MRVDTTTYSYQDTSAVMFQAVQRIRVLLIGSVALAGACGKVMTPSGTLGTPDAVPPSNMTAGFSSGAGATGMNRDLVGHDATAKPRSDAAGQGGLAAGAAAIGGMAGAANTANPRDSGGTFATAGSNSAAAPGTTAGNGVGSGGAAGGRGAQAGTGDELDAGAADDWSNQHRDLIEVDCRETLACGQLGGALDNCIDTEAELLNRASDETRAVFVATMLRCSAEHACDYVACSQR